MHGTAVSSEEARVEPAGLERTFREHQARVFRAAYRITGNAHDAEDVLQTVFLRLASQGEDSPALANPASYLYRAAINCALDVLRARRERPSVPLDEVAADVGGLASDAATPERVLEAAELRTWLRVALASLTPQAALMFALRYLEGESHREIAGQLGISRVSVAVTLFRTRVRLQNGFRAWKRGQS